MATLFGGVFTPATDSNNDPISGATWKFYLSGTTTLATVYADADEATPLENPVEANASGVFPAIYLRPAPLRAVLNTPGGAVLKDIDPANPIASTGDAIATFAALGNLTVGSSTHRLSTAGYYEDGDGGGADYREIYAGHADYGKDNVYTKSDALGRSWQIDATNAVSPLQLGAIAGDTFHALTDYFEDEDDYRQKAWYGWAVYKKYLWWRREQLRDAGLISGDTRFADGADLNYYSINDAAFGELICNPLFKRINIPPQRFALTDMLCMEFSDKTVFWADAYFTCSRRSTRGNMSYILRADRVTFIGKATWDANFIPGNNAFGIGNPLTYPPAIDSGEPYTLDPSQFPPEIQPYHNGYYSTSISIDIRVMNTRADVGGADGGGKGFTGQQGYTGLRAWIEAVNCHHGASFEGRPTFGINGEGGPSPTPHYAARNQVWLDAKDCIRSALMLSAPTTPAPSSPLNTGGIIHLTAQNCGFEYGSPWATVVCDRPSDWEVVVNSTHRPREFDFPRTFGPAQVNVATNTLTVDTTGWTTGDRLLFGSSGSLAVTMPQPLSPIGNTLFAIKDGAMALRLALTRADALAGIAIDITTTGSDYKGDEFQHMLENVETAERITFEPADINTTTGEIDVGDTSTYESGLECFLETSGVLPTGFSATQAYFIKKKSATTICLMVDYAAATIYSDASVSIADTDIDVTTNIIHKVGHGLANLQVARLRPGSVGPTFSLTQTDNTMADEVISSTTTVVIIKIDDDNFKLAESSSLAKAGTAIDIKAAGTGPHAFGNRVIPSTTGSGVHTVMRPRAAILLKGTPKRSNFRIRANVDSIRYSWLASNYQGGSNHTASMPDTVQLNFNVNVRGEAFGNVPGEAPAMIRELISGTGGTDGTTLRIMRCHFSGMWTGLPSNAEFTYYNLHASNRFDVTDMTNNRTVMGTSRSSSNVRTEKSGWSDYRLLFDSASSIGLFSGAFDLTGPVSGGTTATRLRSVANNMSFYIGQTGTAEAALSAAVGSMALTTIGTMEKTSGSAATGWVADA